MSQHDLTSKRFRINFKYKVIPQLSSISGRFKNVTQALKKKGLALHNFCRLKKSLVV